MDERLMIIIDRHIKMYGKPCAGSTSDVWSVKSCRDSFACLRGSFVLDGDMLAEVVKQEQYQDKLVDMSPILAFARFASKHHTGAVLAKWKKAALQKFNLADGVGLATEDGASNNKKANKILNQDQRVCDDHEIARAVLHAAGETGTPATSKNPPLRAFTSRSSKQAGAFSRSVVANTDLREAQLQANPDLKPSRTLMPKVKNVTRWLGLQAMCNRNRRIGQEMCIALTGDRLGHCEEEPADPALVEDNEQGSDTSSEGSEGEVQEAANHTANKNFPLAHRCLTAADYRNSDLFESVLDRPRELTLLVQDAQEGWGEGLDIGVSHLNMQAMRDEARAERLEVVSGRGATETWKEVSAASLPAMFKLFRIELAAQLTKRFRLDTMPSKHVLLALKMNPAVNTQVDGPTLAGRFAVAELMDGEYKRALRRQGLRQANLGATHNAAPDAAPTIAAPAADGPAVDAAPAAAAPTVAAATAAAAPTAAAEPTTHGPEMPAPKKRRSLQGAIAAQQSSTVLARGEDESLVDVKVLAEIEKFDDISCKILAKVCAPPSRLDAP